MRVVLVASLAAAFGCLVLAHCGGGDDNTPGSTTSSTSSSSSSTSSSGSTSTSSSGSTTSSSSSGTSGGDGGSDAAASSGSIATLSDDFATGSLLSLAWSVLRPELIQLSIQNQSLSIRASQQSLWFNASQGSLVYKNVSGDFRVTSRVHTHRATMTTVDPVGPIHLGGLMARNPAGPPENYVFIVVGRDENDISVETKTTTNGASTYVGPTWPTADAELRLCRVGTSFTVYKRPLGGGGGGVWTLAQTFTRADLPGALQVGPFIYANTNQPDFEALFDEVTFAPVTNAADCTN